jgi:hypothetical protein
MWENGLKNNQMLSILIRILFEEYLESQLRALTLHDETIQKNIDIIAHYSSRKPRKDKGAYGYLDWMKDPIGDGESKSYYRGYIIVPEILLQEGLLRGKAKQVRIDEILEEPGGIYEFFRDEPRDGVTVIKKDEILYGLVLLSIEPAEKILGAIDHILKMYIPDFTRPGTRTWTSAAAAVLLNHIPELEKISNTKKDLTITKDIKSLPRFYDGNVYCKCQSSEGDPKTAPLFIIRSNETAAAEFCFQKVIDCQKSFTNNRSYFTGKGEAKSAYIFHKEVVTNETIIGYFKNHHYDDGVKEVVTRESLISPKEVGIDLKEYAEKYVIIFNG